MKQLAIFALVLMLCTCGGGDKDTTEDTAYADIDQLVEEASDLDISQGMHLPDALIGSFRLVRIDTVSKSGGSLGSQTIDPTATISLTASRADPYDAFEGTSNLITKEPIEVAGEVSLDLVNSRLIVHIASSNTTSIVESEIYSLPFGSSGGAGFSVTIEGSINGEAVDQVYVFEKKL